MKNVILITGCARSGTSMVAGVVDMCGAFGGDMSGPNKSNKKGMFENYYIRNQLVKPYLTDMKADAMGQYPLPDIAKLNIPMNWRDRVEQIMKEQGFKDGPWFYKGAKMTLMWPVWHYAFPNAKWIIVRRRTGDIINSCLKTSFMRAFSKVQFRKAIGVKDEKEGWKWWVRQHEQRFVEMLETGLNAKIVWPERMVMHDYQQMMETIEWLGLDWNDQVLSFISPKLWNSRKKIIGR